MSHKALATHLLLSGTMFDLQMEAAVSQELAQVKSRLCRVCRGNGWNLAIASAILPHWSEMDAPSLVSSLTTGYTSQRYKCSLNVVRVPSILLIARHRTERDLTQLKIQKGPNNHMVIGTHG